MSEMVERIGAAIAKLGSVDVANYQHREMIARAALEAMREPTSAMCDAGEGFNIRCGCPECDHSAQEKVANGFRAMIDVALRSQP